jgi:hypothetical protein
MPEGAEMIPPRPGKPPTLPQYVGDGDYRFDAAKLSDRGIAIKGLDLILRLQHSMQVHSGEFMSFKKAVEDDKIALLKMATEYEYRLSALEGRPREALASSHEWTELLTAAGQELSKRVKNPRDPLDSDRARHIAQEVIETAKTAADASAYRTLRSRGAKILFAVLKAIAIAALGFGASHFGLHSGRLTNDVPAVHSAGGK